MKPFDQERVRVVLDPATLVYLYQWENIPL